jgi:hypothetical protein
MKRKELGLTGARHRFERRMPRKLERAGCRTANSSWKWSGIRRVLGHPLISLLNRKT